MAKWHIGRAKTALAAIAALTLAAIAAPAFANGTLQIPYSGKSKVWVRKDGSSNRIQAYDSSNGKFSLPEGSYSFYGVQLNKKDSDGNEWLAYGISEARKKITIAKNAVTKLKIGGNLQASIQMKETSEGRASASFVMKDDGGNNFVVQKAKGEAAAPGFKVFDKNGKQVWSGAFKYG